jgi:hypothetical protein
MIIPQGVAYILVLILVPETRFSRRASDIGEAF